VKDWRTLTSCPDVVVVPFFIADGLHSFEDIPVLLGLTHNVREQGFLNPHREGDRRLWYATALGTEGFLADVIVAQVKQAEADYPEAHLSLGALSQRENSAGELMPFLEGQWVMGEVRISPGFELRHKEDRELAVSELTLVSGLAGLREWIRLDANGNFRPLRAAPNLLRGWIYQASDLRGLQDALDYLYPVEVANWGLWKKQELPITNWRETAERQTGRFRVVRELDLAGVDELVRCYCEPGCLKKRLWSPAQETVEPRMDELPLLCPEACNFLVGKAREKLKGASEE
jgi:sirohydrochlorin cobaltochelatase